MDYKDYRTEEPISREQYIINGIERGRLLDKLDCGCVLIEDRTAGSYIVYCYKHEAAPDLYEALKYLPERKSLLADAAYTGGDLPKKWINDMGYYYNGYNQALIDIALHREQALAKAEGKDARNL